VAALMADDVAPRSELVAALHSMESERCWAVFYGPASGCIIQLHFEPQVRRSEPLQNPMLTEDERWFDGTFVLYASCLWIVERAGQPVLNASEAVLDSARFAQAMEGFLGERLVSANVDERVRRATFDFTEGMRLTLVCDGDVGEANYHVTTPAGIFVLGRRGA
jgi:hypothetical protein